MNRNVTGLIGSVVDSMASVEQAVEVVDMLALVFHTELKLTARRFACSLCQQFNYHEDILLTVERLYSKHNVELPTVIKVVFRGFGQIVRKVFHVGRF